MTTTTRLQADKAIIDSIFKKHRDAINFIHADFLEIFAEAMAVNTSLIFVLQAPRHKHSTILAMKLAANWHRTEDVLFFSVARRSAKSTAEGFLNPEWYKNNDDLGVISSKPVYARRILLDGGTRVTVSSVPLLQDPPLVQNPKDLIICDNVMPAYNSSVWINGHPLVIIDSGSQFMLPFGHFLISDLFSPDLHGKDNIPDENKIRYRLRIYQKNPNFINAWLLENGNAQTNSDNETQSE